MGHIGIKGLHSATDSAPSNNSDHPPCEVCARANIRRSPFPKLATHRATRLLQQIHCDICGPLPPSYGNFQYYILFIDCYSRFISLFLMKNRSEALSLFIQFKTTAEKFTGENIKLLRVDNAPELIQGQMQNYCKTQGIIYEKTVPDSPPQNGVAECTNLTICSMARAMLIDANLRDYFWPFAVLTAVHIKQRIPHSSLPTNVTPFQLWFQHCPNLSHLRPFGAKCTTRIITNHQSKFEPRGESGRFVGYAKDSKGYLIWVTNQDNHGGTLKVRRDIIFHNLPVQTASPNILPDYLPLWEGIDFPDQLQSETQENSPSYMSNPNHTTSQRSLDHTNSQRSSDHTNSQRSLDHTNSQRSYDHTNSENSCTQTNTQIRPRRITHLPSKYTDFVPSNIIVDQLLALDDEELTIPLPNGPSSIHDIVGNVLNADLILDNIYINTSDTNNIEEQDPPTVRHTQRSKYWNEWLAAMHEELEALKAKGVYEEVAELPPSRKAVQCKWVLRIK